LIKLEILADPDNNEELHKISSEILVLKNLTNDRNRIIKIAGKQASPAIISSVLRSTSTLVPEELASTISIFISSSNSTLHLF